MPHWRMMMISREKWDRCAVQQTRGTFAQCPPAVKTLYFLPNACQLWRKYTQTKMKRLRVAYNAYRIMRSIGLPRNVYVHGFARTKLTIMSASGHLMPWFETICRPTAFYNVAHLHLTFLSDHFKWLMLFKNPHFSSIIYRSCMTVTNCSSCWCVVSVYVSSELTLRSNQNISLWFVAPQVFCIFLWFPERSPESLQ